MKRVITIVSLYVFPTLVSADSTVGSITDLLTKIKGILQTVFPLMISVAVIYFVYQVLMYTISGDEDKKKTAKGGMIYGIIGLFVMVSIWGLVAILSGTFGFSGSEAPTIPGLPGINFSTK